MEVVVVDGKEYGWKPNREVWGGVQRPVEKCGIASQGLMPQCTHISSPSITLLLRPPISLPLT